MGDYLSGNVTQLDQAAQSPYFVGDSVIERVEYSPEGISLIAIIVGIVLLYFALAWNAFDSIKKRRREKQK